MAASEDNLNLINVIATAFSSIVTGISLIYLFISDYKKSKRISDLERVAEVLEKDLMLRYQPHLWINVISLRQLENRINFDINNKREWCKLTKFNIISGDLVLDEGNQHLPYELEPKFSSEVIQDTTRRYIYTINNSDKNLNDVTYDIEVLYEDRLQNRYSVNIKGTGAIYSLTPPKLLQ
ncbi:hypothetical protein QQY79_15105 [Flavobacterium tructae]|uniref:hypothetical protein n=1 Tax=Flavobacterium tructae TaxID=1114873 RepID=UPI002551D986|nr:hypothetical protein [Flavobacterium tructae]MDL2143854.1 hypothetical protein [Flavobacterium tructae]